MKMTSGLGLQIQEEELVLEGRSQYAQFQMHQVRGTRGTANFEEFSIDKSSFSYSSLILI